MNILPIWDQLKLKEKHHNIKVHFLVHLKNINKKKTYSKIIINNLKKPRPVMPLNPLCKSDVLRDLWVTGFLLCTHVLTCFRCLNVSTFLILLCLWVCLQFLLHLDVIVKLFFQGHSESNVKKPYQHSSISFQTEIHWCSLTHWLLNKLFHCGNLKLLSLILQASHNSLCLSNPCFCASVVVCFYQTFKDLKVWMVMNVLNLNEKKINQFFLERQSYYIWLSRVISSLGSLRPPPSSH